MVGSRMTRFVLAERLTGAIKIDVVRKGFFTKREVMVISVGIERKVFIGSTTDLAVLETYPAHMIKYEHDWREATPQDLRVNRSPNKLLERIEVSNTTWHPENNA